MSAKVMLIMANSMANNNKYYYLELRGNDVYREWGRVGAPTPSTAISKNGGEREFNKIKNEKIRKGYREASIDLDALETDAPNGNLLEIAMDQIKSDEDSKELLRRLVEKNIHAITSNTKITYDIKSGFFKTDLGIVKEEGVNKALEILNKIAELIEKGKIETTDRKKFIALNEDYFMIIPTKIKSLRDFNSLLHTTEKVSDQVDICNALLDSIRIIDQEKQKQNKEDLEKKVVEKVFDTKLNLLKNKKEFKRIEQMFETSKNRKHGHSVNSAKVVNIYSVSIGDESDVFDDALGNIMELWHGTKVANLLSILKSGLLMPKYSPGSVTGYMFGQGLYFSNQSTKSLNYCDGMYWNSSARQDKIYLFLADVAMGNYKVPRGPQNKAPGSGFDSYWAKPGESSVLNDEMIVFRKEQIRLKYILEIKL